MLLDGRWAAPSSYALGFVTAGDCSREADMLLVRILILRVMANFAVGQTRAVDAVFQRLCASLDDHPDCHHLRRILLSLRSYRLRACKLYHRIKPRAGQVRLWGCNRRQKNKAGASQQISLHVPFCGRARLVTTSLHCSGNLTSFCASNASVCHQISVNLRLLIKWPFVSIYLNYIEENVF
ncbi:uncharacterized protein LOC133920967 [Phragmites australis]|uniref:uncharacterized protein LOC133920967 n=1 Tax=Phragmites australis TaxID=29695 RepID=UPI002D77767C|nr:uncharacterized protein LOC133920967 [Phragmites australis]